MATYETFTAVYDAVMDDSLYDKWTDFLCVICLRPRREKTELACGTGDSLSQAGLSDWMDLTDVLKIAEKNASARQN